MQDGLVLLDKPAGRTSFEALRPVKKALGTGKVGHAGTLDRFATGLLVVLTGKLTRLIRVFGDTEKRYVATVRFGVETDTLDPEGRTTGRGPIPRSEDLSEAIPQFLGEIEQVPPEYSAVHVDGERAYKRARSGRRVELRSRTVSVRELTVIDYEPPVATLSVRCGSGTYVRSLARDLARAVGSVGHLESLRRTGIAGFEVDESVHPDEFVPEMDLWPPRKVATALPGVGTAVLRPEAVRRVAHGAPLQSEDFLEPPGGEDITLATTEDGEVAAAIQRRGPGFKYVFVAARQEETA